MVDVPRTLDEIDDRWLAEATGWAVETARVEPIGVGVGFMGQLARGHGTSTDPAAPASVIVKLPTTEPGARAIGEMMRVWEREHRFYVDVAPHVTIRVPCAYVAVLDPPCLVLEDLAPATPGDHVLGASPDQARRAVDALASHHASWFQHPRLNELTWMPGLDDPSMAMFPATFELGWPTFLERYRDELPARCLRWCEELVGGLTPWIERHLDDPVTLVHGDFRLDNIFFADDGSVAVIDWQLAMRAPGQTDLVYFCANNLTPGDRRAHEVELIRRYVDALHAAGVPTDAVTFEGVWRGYLEGLVFYASTFGASLLTIDPANERGAALFDALVRRTFTAADDLDAGPVR
ncbi:MAG: phosphotransferase [Ilumatobacteraceae bacterium]